MCYLKTTLIFLFIYASVQISVCQIEHEYPTETINTSFNTETAEQFSDGYTSESGVSDAESIALSSSSSPPFQDEDQHVNGDDIENTEPISFGIRSFTVEVTPPTDKPQTTVWPQSSSSSSSSLLLSSTSSSPSSPSMSSEQPTAAIKSATQSVVNDGNSVTTAAASTQTTTEGVEVKHKQQQQSEDDNLYEGRLKNGLYRIKIAEIITDEFGNGLDDELMGSRNVDGVSLDRKTFPHGSRMDDAGKINIADLYPSKVDDFGPIIRESNDKLLKEKNLFTAGHASTEEQLRSNFMNIFNKDNADALPKKKTVSVKIDAAKKYSAASGKIVTDFTKQLQQSDAVISTIEKEFVPENEKNIDQLADVSGGAMQSSSASTIAPTTGTTVNKKINKTPFIEKRVKKNDPGMAVKIAKKIGFANTKFKTEPSKLQKNDTTKVEHPTEFSTTKFYNNKELMNELHEKAAINPATMRTETQLLHALATKKPELSTPNAAVASHIITTTYPSTVLPFTPSRITAMPMQRKSLKIAIQPNTPIALKPTTFRSITSIPNYSGTIEAKSIIADGSSTSISPSTVGASSTLVTASYHEMSEEVVKSTKASNLIKTTTPEITGVQTSFSRPRIVTRLQEKINSLECDMQNIPMGSSIWRGNETHELNFPTLNPACVAGMACSVPTILWEGSADIQSGDVLIVQIDDTQLISSSKEKTSQKTHKATTAVYQVTRSGHENCDVTEGLLLDITPLMVDSKKLVTLYDKDLTEGINLLIVVSELWGPQCVRLKVTVKSDNCGENADCTGKGVCYSNASMEGYECQCCNGFAGSHCEEIDACSPSPCTNNGICVDLSQGHEGNSYQCLCPYGYTGKNCQSECDPCNPSECQNGGSCIGNSTHFSCECAPGYTGPLCQHNLNECESSPCVHGICVDQEDGFRCFCQPGFSGELCNFEYNECESNPCLNGGLCTDHIGGFSCKCTRGYTGQRCHIKVDFCATNPCSEGHRCVDRGDEFTCECPGGRNGPDCNQVPRTLCNVNPCANGATCWTSEESFYCACRPGYTGKMCEDEFIVETVVSSSEIISDDSNSNIHPYVESSFETVEREKKVPMELHSAYIAAGTLATAIFIVVVVLIACHCKVNKTYHRFTTHHHQLIPIFGFARRQKNANAQSRHWLSGKGGVVTGSNSSLHSNAKAPAPAPNADPYCNGNTGFHEPRTLNRHLAMNLENDMYYTVDFSDSQNSPLIQ